MNDELIPRLIAELLLEMKRLNANLEAWRNSPAAPTAEVWVTGSEACDLLKSEGVRSTEQLKRLRLDGVLSESRGEIRNVSKGDRPTWQYNLPKCRAALKAYFERISA